MFSRIWFNKPKQAQQRKKTVLAPAIPGVLPVKSVDELLSPHEGRIVQTEELAGLSKEHFQRYYLYAIRMFARFVQSLPASEVHHHAGPGGMLSHGLDVCIHALKRRRSYLLSESGNAEEISAKQDLWTYAVFLAALCHDLAKVAVDQKVTIYDGQHRPVTWESWHQFIDEQGQWYATEFVRHRQYRLHEKASPLWLHRIVPHRGMNWLISDKHVLSQWLACVSGDIDNAGIIGEIVGLADQSSVSENLGADNTRLAGVKTKPLHEKMLTALRFLLAEGELPLNRNGAAGWIQGDDCWLVSKRTVDAIRAQLISEGHSGIPTKNGRLFDVLQEHGILIPCGDRAIWSATVEGEGWRNELTLIKIPVARLWLNREARPEEFEGQVRAVIAQAAQSTAENPEKDVNKKETGQGSDAGQYSAEINENDDNLKKETETPSSSRPITPEQQASDRKCPASEPGIDDLTQFLPSIDEVEPECPPMQERTAQIDNQSGNLEPLAEKTHSPFLIPTTPQDVQAYKNADHDETTDPALQFFEWLQTGIQRNQIKVNQAKARVHVVDEGAILVTPGIFQDYARSPANINELAWSVIQQKVLKKNWHVRTDKGLNVIKYRVKGQNKSATINAVLFQDKTRVFADSELPASNPHLCKADE